MKKILLFIFAASVVSFMSAQHVIDIIGEGTFGAQTATLTPTDLGTIDFVEVQATFKHLYFPADGPVDFTNEDGTFLATFQPVDLNLTNPLLPHHVGYFEHDFYDVDGSITMDALNNAFGIYSFFAFIYRNTATSTHYSVIDKTHIFFWHNGSANAYEYIIPITASSLPRNLTIKVVLAEINNHYDGRVAIIDIDAGGVTTQVILDDFNMGEFLNIAEIPLMNVPGTAENVTVSIYSPDPAVGEDDGDSFICAGVVVDVDDADDGCTLTQGYWKTHGKDGPAGPYDETWKLIEDEAFFLATPATYYDVIRTKAKGNAYYILAHQYVAARLNFLSGADPTAAQNAFNDATALFEIYTPDQIKELKGDDPLRQQFIDAKDVLDDYNNGIIGPGHCDDDPKSSEINSGSQELAVYPNPMSNNGTIDFRVANNGQTTAELYNMMGEKVATLFDRNVQADQKFQIRFDASKYTRGLYVIYIRNGSSIQTRKITIVN